MKKLLLINALLLLIAGAAQSQNFPLNSWTQDEMKMARYIKDTTAHAVVLNEFGDSKLEVTGDGNDEHIRLIYNYHVKIKIFDESAFKYGTVEIPLYNNDQSKEEITNITGFTVYNDKVGYKTETLDPEKVYKVKERKGLTTVKFALAGLRPGCIIEYSYMIISPYFEDFRKWEFQNEIPKVHSTYNAHIPGFWTYNVSIRGGLKLSKKTSTIERECFSSHGAKSDCSNLVFGMDSIPPFIEEDYMTAPKNFLSALYFELAEVTNPYNGVITKLAKKWSDVDYQLNHDDNFGGQYKRKDMLKERVLPVIAGKINELDKAKAVYSYIQRTIKWNNIYSIYSNEGIRKALDKHTGDVGDVNLALVSALNAAGINTEAVILSTREYGIVNKLYPVITEFNYVVAKANIGDKSYLLDATDPLLSFGMLPLRCLNDQGRVMSINKPSYWTDMTTAQNEDKTYVLNLALQETGKLKGTFAIYSKGYAAYKVRKAIKKFNSVDEYVENLDEKLTAVKISKSDIANVDSLDLPVAETYEIEINAFESLNHAKLSFNPYLFDRITTNPFKLAERVYPVDWGMPSETKFILQMQLPENYTVENPPQNLSIALPLKGGSFIVQYEPGVNSFTFSHNISFHKSIYLSNEYPYLKELYNKIILSEKAEMVFHKKL